MGSIIARINFSICWSGTYAQGTYPPGSVRCSRSLPMEPSQWSKQELACPEPPFKGSSYERTEVPR